MFYLESFSVWKKHKNKNIGEYSTFVIYLFIFEYCTFVHYKLHNILRIYSAPSSTSKFCCFLNLYSHLTIKQLFCVLIVYRNFFVLLLVSIIIILCLYCYTRNSLYVVCVRGIETGGGHVKTIFNFKKFLLYYLYHFIFCITSSLVSPSFIVARTPMRNKTLSTDRFRGSSNQI